MKAFDPADAKLILDLTKAINKLAKAVGEGKPDSFHNRQVPALRRQSDAVSFLRGQASMLKASQERLIDKRVGLEMLKTAIHILTTANY